MSIATEITRLQGIKTDIRTALVTQGIAHASSHNMADFSADILAIQGGSEGVYITVTCDSAYQGYDIILSANESELDRKQCPSSLIVNFFVSADNVTLPTTFTISNNHPDYSGMVNFVSASMYGWYETQIGTILTLYSKESGFIDGYSLEDFVKLGADYIKITDYGAFEVGMNSITSAENYAYLPINIGNKSYKTIHFATVDNNEAWYADVGYKNSSVPTASSPFDDSINIEDRSKINVNDISFDITGKTGTIYATFSCRKDQWSKYKIPIVKLWLD